MIDLIKIKIPLLCIYVIRHCYRFNYYCIVVLVAKKIRIPFIANQINLRRILNMHGVYKYMRGYIRIYICIYTSYSDIAGNSTSLEMQLNTIFLIVASLLCIS